MHQRIAQEVSYLRGFMAADQTLSEKQQQVFDRMLFVMEELAENTHQLDIRLTELEEYVEAVDEDLDDVEQIVFEDEDDLIQLICPVCEEEIMVDQEDLHDASTDCLCPNCHTNLISKEITDSVNLDEPEVKTMM